MPRPGFHGWALESSAVFISPMGDGGNIGLWMQQGSATACIGMFGSPEDAQDFSDFMDAALAATGAANSKLLAQLEGRAG